MNYGIFYSRSPRYELSRRTGQFITVDGGRSIYL